MIAAKVILRSHPRDPRAAETFPCGACGDTVTTDKAARLRSRTCSRMCTLTLKKERERAKQCRPCLDLPKGSIGAVSELIVCADLLKRGFEVFRAVAPSCSCDLLISKPGHILKVEVRTGFRSASGAIQASRRKFRADCFAFVLVAQSEIVYEPPLPA